jgi:hypothetical protein
MRYNEGLNVKVRAFSPALNKLIASLKQAEMNDCTGNNEA